MKSGDNITREEVENNPNWIFWLRNNHFKETTFINRKEGFYVTFYDNIDENEIEEL